MVFKNKKLIVIGKIFCKFFSKNFYKFMTLLFYILLVLSTIEYNKRQNILTFIKEYEFKEERMANMGNDTFELLKYSNILYGNLRKYVVNSCFDDGEFLLFLENNFKSDIGATSNIYLFKNIFNNEVFEYYSELHFIFLRLSKINRIILFKFKSNNCTCECFEKILNELRIEKENLNNLYMKWSDAFQQEPFKNNYYKSI